MRRGRLRWAFLLFLFVGSIAALDQGGRLGRSAEARESQAPGASGKAGAPKVKEKRAGEPGRRKARKPARFAGAFASPAACRDALRELRPRARTAPARIATWNVRWFPRGTHDGRDPTLRTDIAWLACAIASLQVDALGLQEILDDPEARVAGVELITQLDALTQGRWKLELDDCSAKGHQHVGLLWNEARVAIDRVRVLAAINPAGSACASGLRPGLAGHARFTSGEELSLVVLHLDSGEKPRDFDHRAQSVAALDAAVASLRARAGQVVVLGDYNSMGCKECAPKVSAADELGALDASLATAKLSRVAPERFACSHYYERHAGMLDHIAVTAGLRARASVEPAGVCAALACQPPKRGERPIAWDTLSDHCPVVLELK